MVGPLSSPSNGEVTREGGEDIARQSGQDGEQGLHIFWSSFFFFLDWWSDWSTAAAMPVAAAAMSSVVVASNGLA
jgi:hypothetical protein